MPTAFSVDTQILRRRKQRKGSRQKHSFRRRSVPKCRTDLLQSKNLHRFEKMKPIFTVSPFLPLGCIAQKYREIKGFCAVIAYLAILDKW